MRTYALFLLALSAAAQQAPRFEVASVRASAPDLNQVRVGFSVTGQQARLTAIPLGYYIGIAYNANMSQVIGPAHLQDRFDISGTIPEGVKLDKLPEMLQGVLDERFQAKIHRESREMQVYVITSGKGRVALKEVADAPSDPNGAVTAGGTGSAQGISADLGNGSSYTFSNNQWVGKKLTFEQLAAQLEQFVDHPVVDQTGLKGRYDMTLELTAEDYQVMRIRGSVNAGFPVTPQLMQRVDAAQFTSLYEAFEKLGLKLEIKKLAQPVIVVDSVLKVPTEN
jgi:uncharacterized protein (TIGR03435 family)